MQRCSLTNLSAIISVLSPHNPIERVSIPRPHKVYNLNPGINEKLKLFLLWNKTLIY